MLPSNAKQTPRCIIMLDCNSYTYRHHSISQQYPHTPDGPLASRLCVVAPESLPLPWPTSTSTLLHPLLYLCICLAVGFCQNDNVKLLLHHPIKEHTPFLLVPQSIDIDSNTPEGAGRCPGWHYQRRRPLRRPGVPAARASAASGS